MSDKFVKLQETLRQQGNAAEAPKDATGRKSVIIKGVRSVGAGKKRVIGISQNDKKAKIEPIISDNHVQGIRLICSCGEITQIFFQYDNEPASQK